MTDLAIWFEALERNLYVSWISEDGHSYTMSWPFIEYPTLHEFATQMSLAAGHIKADYHPNGDRK